ncbi:TetR/AcrR family transcriptional regulator [Nocardioides jiangxiensis]|uniref:TetR/AcrR family transcriptional regulator n=1 Tax=Nocardioides jiangxiensis TaxID=3064524 RepID=A0ABT9B3R5_9ACTN|nr:TetR/AcrR family transcriptional regulator [Nocardioides sp. WY-20]MDO7869454.1 TetR/AcrR family transcriptional regulator [Nocardioides sp. WY-20]
MPKGPTKRRPETRAKLLAAAGELFARQGVGATSIGEICRQAGYTTGAFYSNFESKDELFFTLFDAHAAEAIETIRQRLEALDVESLTVEELIAPFAHIRPEERDWFLISSEFTLFAIRNSDAARKVAEHDARARAMLTPVVTRLLAAAGVTSPAGVDHFCRYLIALREGGLAQSLVEPENLDHGELERTYLPRLLRGFEK